METLKNKIRKNEEKRFNKYINRFKDLEHRDSLIRRDAPKSKRFEKLTTEEEQINFIIDLEKKAMEKRITKEIETLERIYATEREIKEISITVEWKKNKMWGANPTATAIVYFKNGGINEYYSKSIGGCGYDKESAAVGQALNKCDELLKLMYEIMTAAGDEAENHSVLGYGSGYGVLPYFEGGVGIDCFYKIFSKLGYTMRKVASGKMFDVYNVSKVQ